MKSMNLLKDLDTIDQENSYHTLTIVNTVKMHGKHENEEQ